MRQERARYCATVDAHDVIIMEAIDTRFLRFSSKFLVYSFFSHYDLRFTT